MAAKRLSPLTVTLATLCAAGAAWVSGGALTVVSAQPYAARVGVLSSLPWLALWVLLAIFAAATSRSRSDRLALLGLSAVLFAPWLPFRVPSAAYVWTGPLRTWLWTLLGAAILLPAIARSVPMALSRLATNPRRAPWVAALVAAIVYLAGANRVFPQLPAGDEPHYLVIAQSLLLDHDLKIENNHRRRDYRAYYPVELKPDYRSRGADNEIYSIHAPGLPAIIVPAFALFGYPGVLTFLAIVSGLASALAWFAAWRVTSDVWAAWFGWAAVALTAPFYFQSFVAYPDALAAALVMVGVLTLSDAANISPRRLLLAGIALAILPWLHTRYVILAISLGLLIAVRQINSREGFRRMVVLFAMPAISAACWFGFFYLVYGTPDPRAPYGGSTQSTLAGLPQGLIGLLFDQQFGLLPAAPIYLCALPGLVLLARRLPRLTVELLVLAVPYGLVVAAYEMWWGGESSPARFLVPVLLPLSIPAAVWFQTSRGRAARLLGLGGLAISLMITLTLAGVDRGALLYNSRDGASRLFLWLSPLVNISMGLPSVFRESSALALAHAGLWLAALALAAAVGVLAERRGAGTTGTALALGFSVVLAASAALSVVWRSQPTPALTVGTGTLAFLHHYDPDQKQIALRTVPFRRVNSQGVLSTLTLADVAPAAIAADAPPVLLFRLPAGTYAVEATSTRGMSGHVTATLDRTFGSQWQWNLDARGAWREEIRLPVEVPAILVNADPTARQSLDRMVLRPVSILGSSHLRAPGEPQHIARYGPAVVYLMSGAAYMEQGGAWVVGGSSADFVLAPDNHSVQLFVRNPPIDNVVTLQSGAWRHELTLKSGEERLVSLPAPDPATGGLPLRVTAGRGARPSEFEHGDTDTRLLGCWIEVRP